MPPSDVQFSHHRPCSSARCPERHRFAAPRHPVNSASMQRSRAACPAQQRIPAKTEKTSVQSAWTSSPPAEHRRPKLKFHQASPSTAPSPRSPGHRHLNSELTVTKESRTPPSEPELQSTRAAQESRVRRRKKRSYTSFFLPTKGGSVMNRIFAGRKP